MSYEEKPLSFDMNRSVVIRKNEGSTLFTVPFWLALLLVIGAPQLVVLVLVAMALEWITVSYEKCC